MERVWGVTEGIEGCRVGLQIFEKTLPGHPSRFWTGTRPEISIIFSVSISKQGYLTIKQTCCLTTQAIHGFSKNIHMDVLCQCCPTFLTPRAAQDIIMKPRAAPVNSKVTTKICWTLI